MEGLGILWTILIGIAAGAIAGWIMRGSGYGILINLVVGILGSFIGRWIYGLLGLSTSSILGILLMSVVGAAVLLWLLSLINIPISRRTVKNR